MFQRAQLEVYGDTVCAAPAHGDAYDAQQKAIEDIFQEVCTFSFQMNFKPFIENVKNVVG